MMKRLVVGVILSALLFCLVAVSAAEKTEIGREELAAAVKQWERSMSGKPINCRRFVDLFIDDGTWQFPAPKKSITGQRRMHRSCEETTFFNHFQEIEAFVTGPIHYPGGNTVAFPHTFLLVTNETMCRMRLHGIAVVKYQRYKREFEPNSKVLINTWQEYFDQEEFDRQMKGCSWPEVDEEAEKAAEAAIKAKLDNDPYVIEAEQRKANEQKNAAKLEL